MMYHCSQLATAIRGEQWIATHYFTITIQSQCQVELIIVIIVIQYIYNTTLQLQY